MCACACAFDLVCVCQISEANIVDPRESSSGVTLAFADIVHKHLVPVDSLQALLDEGACALCVYACFCVRKCP